MKIAELVPINILRHIGNKYIKTPKLLNKEDLIQQIADVILNELPDDLIEIDKMSITYSHNSYIGSNNKRTPSICITGTYISPEKMEEFNIRNEAYQKKMLNKQKHLEALAKELGYKINDDLIDVDVQN